MSATMLNGKLPRKQLAGQLDRLDDQLDRHDSILDALADGLNDAVKDAAQVGVQHAVKAAVIELLTNPELRRSLHEASAPPAPAKPNFWQRCKAKWQALKAKITNAIPGVQRRVNNQLTAAKTSASNALAPIWQFRKVVLAATGIGLLVTVVSSFLSHNVAATLSGIGAAATTLAVQLVLWIRQTLKRIARL